MDNQNSIRFSIIESDADDVPDSEPLESTGNTGGGERWTLPDHAHQIGVGVLKLSGDTDKGSPADCRYQLSEDGGRLRATFTDKHTGNVESVVIEDLNAIDDEELNKLKDDLDRNIKLG